MFNLWLQLRKLPRKKYSSVSSDKKFFCVSFGRYEGKSTEKYRGSLNSHAHDDVDRAHSIYLLFDRQHKKLKNDKIFLKQMVRQQRTVDLVRDKN